MSLYISQRFSKSGASVAVNLHNLKSVTSDHGPSGSGWARFADHDGNDIVIHCDPRLAEMLSEAFDAYHDELSGQEGPAFDDALGAKCDAAARDDAARAMK